MPYKDITTKRRRDREYWLKVKGKGPASVQTTMNRAIDVVKSLPIRVPKGGLKIGVLTDGQVMPGVPLEYLGWAGQYFADKRCDVIVCIGDFGDFPSLSRFGRGELDSHNKRWAADLAAYHEGMQQFVAPIEAKIEETKSTDNPWEPDREFCEGNHESHIDRIVQEYPFLEGTIDKADLCLEEYGWRVHPFLQPISIGGVAFCHYFPSGKMGHPITSAAALMNKLHMSAFAGHQQGRDIHYARRADGGQMTAIISGSYYPHKMKYLSPFTNAHWRGLYVLHQVRNGEFDEMPVSLEFLRRKYG